MINLYDYKGFCLLQSDKSLEANRLSLYCLTKDIELKRIKTYNDYDKNYVPSGSVEFCEQILGYHIIPDYYPEWLNDYLYRKVWKSNKWILGKKLFIKPADRYKRFTGFITYGTYAKKKKPPYWYSDIINIKDEYRYYISNGKILCGYWYWGNEKNEDNVPELQINIPKNFCGAIDFGIDNYNKLVLIESQHPFACGWYGPNEKDYLYFQWLINGWNYLINR